MRCLYCGKQLPLLKKLTGGGEFCSEAHRQKYQEEYNKLALSRLLQTQNADTEAPHRGELVLSSRQHPALQAGRPPLRALEAPKAPTEAPVAGNWAPGANRTQRALPPPSLPPPTALPNNPPGLRGPDPAPGAPPPFKPAAQAPSFNSDQQSFLKPPPGLKPPAPLPPPMAPQTRIDPKNESFRFDQPRADQPRADQSKPPDPRLDQGRTDLGSRMPEPVGNKSGKRDAFTFRPMDPFPEQKQPAPPPPPPPVVAAEEPTVSIFKSPVEKSPVEAPTPSLTQDKAPEPAAPTVADPPQAPFMVEEVHRADPPPVPKLQMLGAEPLTKGYPPKPDGWQRWEPEVQGPPGELEEPDDLFQLTGPPGLESPGDRIQIVSEKEESEQDRLEIRRKILENQVKPGDFKQTVPTAPNGPNTVLPICPPAPALEQVDVSVKPKAPAANPKPFAAAGSTGEELWTGWTATAASSLRAALAALQDIPPESLAAVEPLAALPAPPPPAPVPIVSPAPVPLAPVVPAAPKPASTPAPVFSAKPPVVELPRNYKAAEALKSAAQTVIVESAAPKVEVRQPDKPAVRHEVFVDLSVLGIEEDEDADAETLAREGESPPGLARPRRRKNSSARQALRDLVNPPHPPAAAPPPEAPKPASNVQPPDWKVDAPSYSLRLSNLPLRPKIVFEQLPALPQQSAAAASVPAPAAARAGKESSPLAAAWSARRLKKSDTGTPLPPAPGDSGTERPVETPVAEPQAPEPARFEHESSTVEAIAPAVPARAQAPIERVPPPADAPLQESPKLESPTGAVPAPAQPKVAGTLKQEAPVERTQAPVSPKSETPDAAVPALAPPQQAALRALREEAREAAGARPPSQTQEPTAPPTAAAEHPKTVQRALERSKKLEPKKDEPTPSSSAPPTEKPAISTGKLPTPRPIPAKPPFDAPLLNSTAKSGSFWANLPVLPKVMIALVLVAAIAGGTWFVLNPNGKASPRHPADDGKPVKRTLGPARVGRNLMADMPGGWSPDWGGDFNRKKNRTISLYRPSVNFDDYRMEFEGQIDSKALGWVYRAVDQRNYYAYKVEIIRTGAEPTAALAHIAVVNGDEGQKHYSPLSKPVRAGSNFRVRLDVRGDEFSAYINDELIEVWQDDRLPKGGFGLMTEAGEVGQIRKLQVFELLP